MIAASRVAIAGSLIAFLVGSTLGLSMGVGWLTLVWRPAHAHLQNLGFVTLMIQGVAYHVLPRFNGVPFRRPRVALIQVVATIVAVAGMTAGWGLQLGAAWFATFGSLAWLANATFVAIGLELLLRRGVSRRFGPAPAPRAR